MSEKMDFRSSSISTYVYIINMFYAEWLFYIYIIHFTSFTVMLNCSLVSKGGFCDQWKFSTAAHVCVSVWEETGAPLADK